MLSIRALSSASLLGLLVTLAACSGEASSTNGADTTDTARAKDTAVTAEQTPATAGQAGRPMHGPPGGPDFLLMAALHEPSLNLTADQKSTIESALEASKPAAPAFDKTRVSALAAGIRAGKVEASTVKAPSEDGMAARQAASAKALGTLHATLTADQRKALVAAVAQHHADHDGKMGMDHHGPPPGAKGMGPMGGMLEGLNLTQAQQDSIHAQLEAQRPAPPSDADRAAMKAQHEQMRTAMQAKLQTFASDSFDATAFVTPPAGAKPGFGPDHADHFAKELAIITSVLDPAQREALATRIEAGPQARINAH